MSVLRGLLLSMGALAIAVPAAAQTMTTSISGVIGANNVPGPDIDTLGLFGKAGANLNGKQMTATLTFAAAQMSEGGAAPGYSAWSGPSGTCAVKVHGVPAKPPIDQVAGINANRIYFYSDYQGVWALDQDAQSSTEPNGCSISISSTKSAFVPSANLVQSFSYMVRLKERPNDALTLDITVNGTRETVTANVVSVKYGP